MSLEYWLEKHRQLKANPPKPEQQRQAAPDAGWGATPFPTPEDCHGNCSWCRYYPLTDQYGKTGWCREYISMNPADLRGDSQ